MKHSQHNSASSQAERAPRGVGRQAVNMRIPAPTRAELRALATAEGKSESFMAGIIFTEGLNARKAAQHTLGDVTL